MTPICQIRSSAGSRLGLVLAVISAIFVLTLPAVLHLQGGAGCTLVTVLAIAATAIFLALLPAPLPPDEGT